MKLSHGGAGAAAREGDGALEGDVSAFPGMEPFTPAPPDQGSSRSLIWLRRIARTDASILALGAFTLLACTTFTSLLLSSCYRREYFVGDDFISLWIARSMPLGKFILEPLNEHIVPLHRLVLYSTDAVAPMNYTFALFVLFGFYALGAIYLYRILLLIEGGLEETSNARSTASRPAFVTSILLRTKASWFLLSVYCSNVYLGALYCWWTAGLHRLPYIALANMAIYYFLRHRAEPRWRFAVLCVVCSIAAFGFFTKAVLIPIYLLALEVCLVGETPRAKVWKHLKVVAVLGAVSAAFLVLWHKVEPPGTQALNTNLPFQLEFLKNSWLVLRESAIGAIHVDNTDPLALGFVLWIVALTYTLSRRPSTLVVWIALAAVVALNVLLTSASKHRTGGFGMVIALFSFRYYYEMVFLIVVFAALAFQRVRAAAPAFAAPSLPSLEIETGEERTLIRDLSGASRPALGRWLPALGCMALISVLMLNSRASWKKSRVDNNGIRARDFVERLEHDRRRIQKAEPGPLRFVDGQAPYVGCSIGMLLAAMKVQATPVPAGPGAYMVLASGQLVPAS